MLDRNDPVLARLPDDDDLPRSFLSLPAAEQAWRGRFFAVVWSMSASEAYAWSIALAPDPHGENQRVIKAGSDQQVLDDLAAYPFRPSSE